MKLFVKKLFIFLLPLCVIFGFPFYVLLETGELESVDNIVARQSKTSTVRVGFAYTSPLKYYKLRGVQAAKPSVIALGTSRILQIRSEFFKKGVNFYNAGNGIEKIGQFEKFLDRLKLGSGPEIFIISVDQNFLNPNWDKLSDDNYEKELARNSSSVNIVAKNWDKVFLDFFAGKFSLNSLRPVSATAEVYGLNAIVNSNYFRNDGTYHYGKYIADSLRSPQDELVQNKETFEMMESGVNYFRHADRISEGAVARLESFLKKCRSLNIHVAGFMPPYSQSVYDRISAAKDRYAYIYQIEPRLKQIFEKYGYTFFDFSDMRSFGAGRAEIIDSFHASEKAYLRMFLKMTAADHILEKYSADRPHLEKCLSECYNNYEVFGE